MLLLTYKVATTLYSLKYVAISICIGTLYFIFDIKYIYTALFFVYKDDTSLFRNAMVATNKLLDLQITYVNSYIANPAFLGLLQDCQPK